MDNKMLFITALHGDEGFGVEVLKKVENALSPSENNYEWFIANEEAYKNNVRYIEKDLNRVAPGDLNSDIYEEKRAAEIIEKSKNFSFAIDIHGTKANTGIFAIVTNPTVENLILAASIPVENIVIWAAKSSKENGPVTQYLECPSLEIECGPKTDNSIHSKLEEIVVEVIQNRNKSVESLLANTKKQSYFTVTGTVENIDNFSMKEFEKTEVNGEEFYPLLINSYKNGSVRKMKKIDFFEIFSY